MEKSCKKCAPKSPDTFLLLVNNTKQPLHSRNSFKNKIFIKRIIKKTLTLFFLLNPVPFNGLDYEKEKEF